jgi:hypothetical protein
MSTENGHAERFTLTRREFLAALPPGLAGAAALMMALPETVLSSDLLT